MATHETTDPAISTVLMRAYWSHWPAGSRSTGAREVRVRVADARLTARAWQRSRHTLADMELLAVRTFGAHCVSFPGNRGDRDLIADRADAHQRARILHGAMENLRPRVYADWPGHYYAAAAHCQERIGNGEQPTRWSDHKGLLIRVSDTTAARACGVYR